MFHKSNLGSFGESLPTDLRGYVAEEGDNYDDFEFDTASIRTEEDADWHRNEWFPEWVGQCLAATKESEQSLEDWRA